jgi:hypothetical protein
MTLPLRFLLIIVSSVAYLALAFLGRGGVAAFFSHPALVALTVVFFGLIVYDTVHLRRPTSLLGITFAVYSPIEWLLVLIHFSALAKLGRTVLFFSFLFSLINPFRPAPRR